MSFLGAFYWVKFIIRVAIGVAGLVGAVTALATREDAFTAADRQPKMVWVGLLLAASLLVIFGSMFMGFLGWIAMVIIGIYWFDVRPQIKDILDGNYHW